MDTKKKCAGSDKSSLLSSLADALEAEKIENAVLQSKYLASQAYGDSMRMQFSHLPAYQKTQAEFQSARYIIGTSIYDIMRHPLHSSDPIKRIRKFMSQRGSAPQAGRTYDISTAEEKRKRELIKQETRRAAKEAAKRVWLIKCPAPENGKVNWGDYHFSTSLADALTRQGQYVEIQMLDDWDEPVEADVILVLRGLHKYRRQQGSEAIHIMWNISHPESVSEKEYNSYDIVFIASNYYANIMKKKLQVPVFPLLQCTDITRFYVREEEKALDRSGLVFIGNGRTEGRMCVNWAAESNELLKVYGMYWDQYLDNSDRFVVAESIENSEIRKEYIKSKATLNDHWTSMKAYQFINNRVFDALACELPIISDTFDELQSLFPEELLYYTDEFSLRECIYRLNKDYSSVKSKIGNLHDRIVNEFSFDARARSLISEITAFESSHKKNLHPDSNKEEPSFAESPWDIIVLRGNSRNGIWENPLEMMNASIEEDTAIHKIIVFDPPSSHSLPDSSEKDTAHASFTGQNPPEYADEEEFGLSVSEKVARYRYTVPESKPFFIEDYKRYIQYVVNKENIGRNKILLWVIPDARAFESFTDVLDIDLLISDYSEYGIVFSEESADGKADDRPSPNDPLLSRCDCTLCGSKNVYDHLASLFPWKKEALYFLPEMPVSNDALPNDKNTSERSMKTVQSVIGCTDMVTSSAETAAAEEYSWQSADGLYRRRIREQLFIILRKHGFGLHLR